MHPLKLILSNLLGKPDFLFCYYGFQDFLELSNSLQMYDQIIFRWGQLKVLFPPNPPIVLLMFQNKVLLFGEFFVSCKWHFDKNLEKHMFQV